MMATVIPITMAELCVDLEASNDAAVGASVGLLFGALFVEVRGIISNGPISREAQATVTASGEADPNCFVNSRVKASAKSSEFREAYSKRLFNFEYCIGDARLMV